MFSRYIIFAPALTIGVTLAGIPAFAATVTLDFIGTVSSVRDTSSVLPEDIVSGLAMSGQVIYDTETAEAGVSQMINGFNFGTSYNFPTGTANQVTLSFGNTSISTDLSNIQVRDVPQSEAGDSIDVSATTSLTFGEYSVPVANIQLLLNDQSSFDGADLISNETLPSTAGDIDLSAATQTTGSVQGFVRDGGGITGVIDIGFTFDTVNLSFGEVVEPEPEPLGDITGQSVMLNNDLWDGGFDWRFENQELVFDVGIMMTGDVDSATPLISSWESAIDEVWNGAYEVEDGDFRYPIIINVDFFSTDGYEVEIHDCLIDTLCNSSIPGVGNFDMLNWYVDFQENTGNDQSLLPYSVAHELGHMLGLYDEYRYLGGNLVPTVDPGEPYNSNCIFGTDSTGAEPFCGSIMSDLSPTAHERHFEDLLAYMTSGTSRDLFLAQAPSYFQSTVDYDLLAREPWEGSPNVAPVPVPQSMLLLISGFSMLLIMRRRRVSAV